jgi:hypothetical protein
VRVLVLCPPEPEPGLTEKPVTTTWSPSAIPLVTWVKLP